MDDALAGETGASGARGAGFPGKANSTRIIGFVYILFEAWAREVIELACSPLLLRPDYAVRLTRVPVEEERFLR